MADIVRVGFAPDISRDLFVVAAASPDEVPTVLGLSCPYFVCLLACDATAIPETEIAILARRLLKAGCVYVCCWGPGCEQVHDLFDVADLALRPDGPFAMSTWHSKEPLSDALWFFLSCSFPAEEYL